MGCQFSRAALFHSFNIGNVTLSIFYPYIKRPLGGTMWAIWNVNPKQPFCYSMEFNKPFAFPILLNM
jgi:hypothetical protein